MFSLKVFLVVLMCAWLIACGQSSTESKPAAVKIVDPASAGGKLLKKYCSDCHAPPAATVHVAKEWPNVIYRMQERRRMKGYVLMAGDDVDVLVEYMQQHAKR